MFKREKPAASLETLIGSTVTIRGDVEFEGGVHLEGRVLGNLRMPAGGDASLWITEGAEVEGEVRARQASINGRVRGDVHIAGRLLLGPKAVIEGNVHYGSIEMAAGARITGKLLSGGSAGPSATQSLESSSLNPSLQ
jgi:cytoskeletal protein CcmA (bactofilin family)